ncbi:MAG: glycosyltransferase [Saprospiraceae bacterium]|nr:glycosyltransferase [Saprospiraceae bacterium]
MKVTVLSTFDRQGGAAEAAFRHVEALRRAGVNARMLVRSARNPSAWIQAVGSGFAYRKWVQLLEWSERFRYIPRAARRQDWFSFSIGDLGQKLTDHPWIQDADILNPHWVQKGFLSVAELARLSQLGKPMIWHLQDMWAFTGGCHYSGSCTGFTRSCGHCSYLRAPGDHDLSAKILRDKHRLFKDSPFQISTSSQWLQIEAQRSSLFHDREVVHLPMGVDTDKYMPGDKASARAALGLPENGLVILFVAMNVQDERKGFRHLIAAFDQLSRTLTSEQQQEVTLAVLGKFQQNELPAIPFRFQMLGYRNELTDILHSYQSADLFILPSLEDNLPNTVLEAMSCGTPVIGFRSGGVPEMIDDGQTGLLVPSGDAEKLGEALQRFILLPDDQRQTWGVQARQAMLAKYSYPVVAKKHLDHYTRLLGSSS